MRNENAKPRLSIKLASLLVVAVLMFVTVEIFSSLVLIYHYRLNGKLQEDDVSVLSSVSLVNKALVDLGLFPPRDLDEWLPHGMVVSDNSLGWTLRPGKYTWTLKHRVNPFSDWELLPTKVTINDDRSRWTGATPDLLNPNIYIFGDSAVFGTGVNDEQTFAYYLQMARPNYNVKLMAVPGYGLVHNYVRFLQLKKDIHPNDIVIIAYAEYYDVRNVAVPSHIRETEDRYKSRFSKDLPPRQDEFTPEAALTDGDRLTIKLVEQDCKILGDYCKQEDPSPSYLRAVSARLINEMGHSFAGQTILLHIDAAHPTLASKSNPIFNTMDKNIELVSALQEDFGYFMEDRILYFNEHPGPYWHYAIFRKLLSVIQ